MRGLFLVAIAVLGGCGGSPRTIGKGPVLPSTCLGGLCIKPDHVVARKPEAKDRRCVIVAWDGASDVPPTAKVGYTDEAPARPGVFFSIEVPSWFQATPYAIHPDSKSSATVIVARVDPAVRFADARVISEGEVTLTVDGSDVLVLVRAKTGSVEEKLTLTIPRTYNECGLPIAL